MDYKNIKIILFIVLLLFSLSSYSQVEIKKDTVSNKEYYNPIENRIYKAENGFKTYRGGKEIDSIPKSKKETKLEQVIFLSSDEELKASSSFEDLMSIIKTSKLIFNELFSDSKKPGKIMIQFELKKRKNIIQFAIKGDLDNELMKQFEQRIINEEFPKSRNKPIKMQLLFKIDSYDEEK